MATIDEQIAECEAKLVALNAAYDAATPGFGIEEYRFDSGDASQKAIRRKPKEIREEIQYWQSRCDRLNRQKNGFGSLNSKLQRRGYGR